MTQVQKENEIISAMKRLGLKKSDLANFLMQKTKKRHRITVAQAAELMDCDVQFLRLAIQQKVFPFGYAIKQSGKRYTYYVSAELFEEYTKITIPEAMLIDSFNLSEEGED